MPGFMVSGKRHTRGKIVGAHGEEEEDLAKVVQELRKDIREKDRIIAELSLESQNAEDDAELIFDDMLRDLSTYRKKIVHGVDAGFNEAIRHQRTRWDQWRGRTAALEESFIRYKEARDNY